MTDYTIRVNRVPDDIPRDVLIEHIAVAIQKIQKGRKALKKVGIQLIDESRPRKSRKHPFDGPEVNDDLPEAYRKDGPYANGGLIPGDASAVMVVGNAPHYLSKAQVEQLGLENLQKLAAARKDDLPEFFAPKPESGQIVFSGKREDDAYDTTIKGVLPKVPEEVDVIEVELDMDQIVSEVYRAIGEDFPYLADLFQAKREKHQSSEVRRILGLDDPPAEGDWELPKEDHVGDDV